jgi:hypothetical protein
MFIIIFSIDIAGTFISLNAHTELTTENHLATSFLSRGPKISELFLYSIISVIMNDIEYISKDQSIYDLYILSNYYNIELNINSNSIFNSFGKSNYAYLYYQLYIIRQNINYFVNDSNMKQFLVNTVQKEFLFEQALQRLQKRSLYHLSAPSGNQLLTLVTCNTANGNERLIVMGIRKQE